MSNEPAFCVWVMSPVWIRNAGFGSSVLMRATAASKVARASRLASPLNPMCVSLIWAKEKVADAPGDSAASAAPAPIGRDESTPPLTDHTSPAAPAAPAGAARRRREPPAADRPQQARARPRHALQKASPVGVESLAHDPLLTMTLPVISGCKVQKYS